MLDADHLNFIVFEHVSNNFLHRHKSTKAIFFMIFKFYNFVKFYNLES